MEVSVVIPAYNERQNVGILLNKVCEVLEPIYKNKFEVIFIDDGSRDGTYDVLNKIKNKHLVIVKFRKNFGQTAALDAGFKTARGKIIIGMDSDLQNDPRDIPRLIAKLNEGYDVVSGWRHKRRDSFSKKLFSRVSYMMRKMVSGEKIHDSGCSLKAYRKECFDNLDLFGEMHRYIAELLSWKGFRVTEIKVRHHSRKYGKTKYGFSRLLKGFLDLISVAFWQRYSARPIHLFGGTGILLTLIGFILGSGLLIARIFFSYSLYDKNTPLLAVFLFMVGILFLISGLIADIAVKTYYKTHSSMNYNVEKIVRK